MESVLERFETNISDILIKKIVPTISQCTAKTGKGVQCTAPGKFNGVCGKHKKRKNEPNKLYSSNIIYHIGHLPNQFCENCPRCKLQVAQSLE